MPILSGEDHSQRVAFLLCVALCLAFKVVCGSFGIALITP
nr:DUF3265 domain-containing protein [Vibrio cyclitrophicus]